MLLTNHSHTVWPNVHVHVLQLFHLFRPKHCWNLWEGQTILILKRAPLFENLKVYEKLFGGASRQRPGQLASVLSLTVGMQRCLRSYPCDCEHLCQACCSGWGLVEQSIESRGEAHLSYVLATDALTNLSPGSTKVSCLSSDPGAPSPRLPLFFKTSFSCSDWEPFAVSLAEGRAVGGGGARLRLDLQYRWILY